MKNVRAVSSILILIGAVLIEVSYKLLGDMGHETQFRYALVQQLIPAIVGLVLIHDGVRGLLQRPQD